MRRSASKDQVAKMSGLLSKYNNLPETMISSARCEREENSENFQLKLDEACGK
jgi:hypothetical protein